MCRRSESWFKCYPDRWLISTSHLSLEAQGALWRMICTQMSYETPLRDDYSWLAHQLHVSRRKARAIVEGLIEARKLRRTEAGLVNDRASAEIEARAHQRQVNTITARNRERAHNRETSPKIGETSVKQSRKLCETSPKNSENSENLNKINNAHANSCHDLSTTRARKDLDLDIEIDRSALIGLGPSEATISEGRLRHPDIDHDRALANFRRFNAGKKLGDPDSAYLAWLETHAEWQRRRGSRSDASEPLHEKLRIIPGTPEWSAWAEYVGPELAEGARRKGYMLVSTPMPPSDADACATGLT